MTFSLRPIALFIDELNESEWFFSPQFTFAQRIPVPEGMAYDFEVLSGLPAPARAVQVTGAEGATNPEESAD